MPKKILQFIGECFMVLLVLLVFALWFAIGVAGFLAYCVVVVVQHAPRFFGLMAILGIGAVALWVAYLLSEGNEEPENDDYAY